MNGPFIEDLSWHKNVKSFHTYTQNLGFFFYILILVILNQSFFWPLQIQRKQKTKKKTKDKLSCTSRILNYNNIYRGVDGEIAIPNAK